MEAFEVNETDDAPYLMEKGEGETPIDDEVGYLLVISPRTRFLWNGLVLMLTLPKFDLKLADNRVRLIADGPQHRLALAKRLLLQRSASDDFEKSVLKILKEQYDPEFSMGDNMFRDLALSRDLMTEFEEREARSAENKSTEVDALSRGLNVMVLEAAFWPFSTKRTGEAVLPTPMAAVLDSTSLQ